jgi:pimeloyl-ACP methyl ester carboxylesterase
MLRLAGDGLLLAAEAFGDPQAPPVLFFHGGGQSRNAWRASAKTLGDNGYYGLTFDLRGHGDSDWAADGDYLLDAYGRDVEHLVAAFARPVTLVGASRGGQAALVGGARCGDRVRLIMLADVAPAMEDSGIDGIRAFFRASEHGFDTLKDAARALHIHLGQPLHANPAGLAKAMRRGDDGRWHWHWDPKSTAPEFLHPPSEGESLLQAAARVRRPVVLVKAELSSLITPESVAKFRELTPQLEVIEAKNVGHMFTGDRNDAFAQTLLDTLQRH